MKFERHLLSTLRDEFSKPTPVIHVLIGPRQVGKTTIALQIKESINIPTIYATADSPVPLDSSWIETHWKRAVTESNASKSPVLLILDELQKVRGWSETLKILWDSRSGGPEIRVLILGSSSLLMQEGLTESLAGRFFLHRCSHWSYSECKAAFGWNLEQWIFFGGYPGAASFNALINALSTRTFDASIADSIWWGRLIENAVGACLCNNLNSIEYTITYWREGNYEVDYVVARGADIRAIEVKSGANKKLSGLARFQSQYPEAKALIIGGSGIPLEEFFSQDTAQWLD